MAVGGGDAYVATGGVVFALDAMSGGVRWVVRYERDMKGNPNIAQFGGVAQQFQDVDGWEEDTIIPHGRALVVMASDSDKLFALDRRSGQLMWESPRKPTGDDDAERIKQGEIKMQVVQKKGDMESTENYEAKNADDLKKLHPKAHRIYEQYSRYGREALRASGIQLEEPQKPLEKSRKVRAMEDGMEGAKLECSAKDIAKAGQEAAP